MAATPNDPAVSYNTIYFNVPKGNFAHLDPTEICIKTMLSNKTVESEYQDTITHITVHYILNNKCCKKNK